MDGSARAGEYRIPVDPDGSATTIIVRKGKGEAYAEGAAYVVDARQSYHFTGTGLCEYRFINAPRLDEFDNWSSARDRRYDNSGSARQAASPRAQPATNAEPRGQEARPRPNTDKRKDQANDKAIRSNEKKLPEEEPRGRKK